PRLSPRWDSRAASLVCRFPPGFRHSLVCEARPGPPPPSFAKLPALSQGCVPPAIARLAKALHARRPAGSRRRAADRPARRWRPIGREDAQTREFERSPCQSSFYKVAIDCSSGRTHYKSNHGQPGSGLSNWTCRNGRDGKELPPMTLPEHAFFRGRVVPYAEARIGVMTHALHSGTA